MILFGFIRRFAHRRLQYVFKYWDGRKLRRGDPITTWRSLLAHDDYQEDDFELIQIDDPPVRLKVIARLSGVTRDVFGIRTVEEGGLTELACVQLLREFRVYANIQKKSGESTQTSPSTTDSPVSPVATESISTSDDLACS